MSDTANYLRNQPTDIVNPEDDVHRLKPGQTVDLTRIDPTLKKIKIGLGWDVIGFENEAPDLDASVFLLNRNGKTEADEDFVFYNNTKNLDASVVHLGDSRTGAGDGDDEIIEIDLLSLPFEIQKAVFSVSIYDAAMRNHTFKNVRNCYLRIVNVDTDNEMMRFYLDKEFEENAAATGLIVGAVTREGASWVFDAIGQFEPGGLQKIATDYGIVVAFQA